MISKLTYQEKEQKNFDYLVKDLKTHQLYFSLRKNANKGSRRDIFIGTERSNYFNFTLWDIPVSFNGSSANFMDFCIYSRKDNLWTFKLEGAVPKNVADEQIKHSRDFLKRIIPYFNNSYPDNMVALLFNMDALWEEYIY